MFWGLCWGALILGNHCIFQIVRRNVTRSLETVSVAAAVVSDDAVPAAAVAAVAAVVAGVAAAMAMVAGIA